MLPMCDSVSLSFPTRNASSISLTHMLLLLRLLVYFRIHPLVASVGTMRSIYFIHDGWSWADE